MVEVVNACPNRRVPTLKIRRVVRLIAAKESRRVVGALTVVCIDNRRIRRINRQYLRHDHATDVLAFDLSDGPDAPIEGEIYVSLEMAARQAREARVTFTNEVLRLVAHGFLHLLGFDDSTASQRTLMLDTGEKYLAAAERDP